MSDALWMNAAAGEPAYTARELRRAQAMLLAQAGSPDRFGARSGVHPSGVDAVSLSGSTITVHNTKAVVYTALTTLTGPYVVQLLEATHTLAAADGANARKDIVVVRIYDDDEDASGLRQAVSEYIVGTPATTPVDPAVPVGAVKLATITVPADGTGSPFLTFNAHYAVATGGVIPVRTDAELPGTAGGVYDGLMRWRQDTDELQVHNGASTWETVARANPPRVLAAFDTITGLTAFTTNLYGGGTTGYRGSKDIGFPAGFFTATPVVVVGGNSGVPGTLIETSFTAASTSGFTAWAARATSTDTAISWMAVQM
jgi:hypothetical protein